MASRFFRRLYNERGQTLLVLTFLILLLLGALATREMLVNNFVRTVSQNSMEDRMAKEMADSATQEALQMVASLDQKMDLNYDGTVDSKDGPYTSPAVAMEGGEYSYKIKGIYDNERVFYFQLDDVGGSLSWTSLALDIIEDSGGNPVSIGTLTLAAPETDREYRVSVYPGDFSYSVVPRLEQPGGPGGQTLWIRVRHNTKEEPFTTTSAGSDALDRSVIFDPPDPNTGLSTPGAVDLNDAVNATDIVGQKAFDKDTYSIESSGLAGSQRHNTSLIVKRNDLLKYAFFSETNLVFLAGATINGFVYAGTSLSLNAGDGNNPTTFRRPVRVVGDPNTAGDLFDPLCPGTYPPDPYPGSSPPSACQGVVLRGVSFGGNPILLPRTVNASTQAAIAQGNGSDKGGWYDTGGLTLDLSKFSLPQTGTQVYDPFGTPHTLPERFNGLVYSTEDITIVGDPAAGYVGTLNGKSMTIVSEKKIIIRGSIHTGTTFATPPEPVNLGLVGYAGVEVDPTAPRLLHIQAAIAALEVGTTWVARIDSSNPKDSHPHLFDPNDPVTPGMLRGTDRGTRTYPKDGIFGGCDVSGATAASDVYSCSQGLIGIKEVGVYDLDWDGVIEPADNGFGWNEESIFDDPNTPAFDEHPYFLVVRGPIITNVTGTAGSWSWLGIVPRPLGYSDTGEQTRVYQYDPDISRYAPPYFPVALNAIEPLSYSESMTEDRLVPPTPRPSPTPTD